jgi:hypothetical protein
MWRTVRSKTAVVFGAGLAVGLVLGLAVVAGVLLGLGSRPSEMTLAERLLGETQLRATGATGGKSIALATGVIDEGTEGIFVLDYLTGELQCWVINPRLGTFNSMFKYNVIADLGIEQGKTPDYVMTTGVADFRGPTASQVARSVVYVADGNTGNVGCYAVPWNRAAATAGQPLTGPLQRVAVGKARLVAVQE